MQIQKQIKDLLSKSVLVKEESKQKILTKLSELSDLQLEALFVLLHKAEKKQKTMLKRVLESHPDFLDFIENYTATQIDEARKEAETYSIKQDEKKEDELLHQLDKMQK